METSNVYLNNTLIPLRKIEKPEEASALDDYFGFDIRKTLEAIENNFDGLALEIVIEPKESTNNIPERSIEFRLIDDGKKSSDSQHDHSESDEINKLINRIESLQMDYRNLLNQVTTKIDELQEQYSSNEYKITLVKRRIRSGTVPGQRSQNSTSSASSSTERSPPLKRNKRKMSFNNEPDMNKQNQRQCLEDYPRLVDPFSEMLVIGPNGTEIHRKDYEAMHWKDVAGATRELCNIIFGENILATHSLTGNPSPAFRGRERPHKGQLDRKKTADITYLVCSKFNVSQQLVRATITTKCADATKKIKRLAAKMPLI